jgi:hypothetical protein
MGRAIGLALDDAASAYTLATLGFEMSCVVVTAWLVGGGAHSAAA